MQKLKKERRLKEVLEKSRNKKVPELREQEVLKIHCLEEEVLFLVLDLEIMNLNSTKMLKNLLESLLCPTSVSLNQYQLLKR